MRHAFVFLLLLLNVPAFAATTAPVANPVDALKKSLHKDEPAKADAKAIVKASPILWMDLPLEKRSEIMHAWLQLPETTRPPFPVFRDAAIDKDSKSKSAETVSDDETPPSDVDNQDGDGE